LDYYRETIWLIQLLIISFYKKNKKPDMSAPYLACYCWT